MKAGRDWVNNPIPVDASKLPKGTIIGAPTYPKKQKMTPKKQKMMKVLNKKGLQTNFSK